MKQAIVKWFTEGLIKAFQEKKMNLRSRIVWIEVKRRINAMNGSWKTSVGGILLAVGLALTPLEDPAWLSTVGTVLAALGAAFGGVNARDNGVSSEQAGIK